MLGAHDEPQESLLTLLQAMRPRRLGRGRYPVTPVQVAERGVPVPPFTQHQASTPDHDPSDSPS